MSPLTGALSIRARIPIGAAAGDARFGDPLLEDLARRGPLSRERFSTHWSDTRGLASLGESKRAPLPPALANELREYHRRLGASAASLAALDRLARGEAVCTVAGQQPAPLGGPLYSIHKTAAAIGLAAEFGERTGIPCVAMFWMHGEDSDFSEIRGATVADASLTLHDLELPDSAHHEGGLVGAIPRAPLGALEQAALELWSGLPGVGDARALLSRVPPAARDLGECTSALMLATFAEQGLVVIDPRLPAFRAAARGVIDRYLANADTMAAAARRAGTWVEQHIGRRPLSDAALESFVFAIDDGARRKITAAEARSSGTRVTLSPSVALRPAVQDGVLPTVAMACGPGEAAYLLQLREIFEGVGVRPACPVPRLAATWLPPPAIALLEASGARADELVTSADSVIQRQAERSVPGAPLETVERARREAMEGFGRIADASRAVDASLPQLVESARGKADYQYQRLREALVGKVRKKIERHHPDWLRLRYYLMPGEKLQERRLASLEIAAYRGIGLAVELTELARDHARRLIDGTLEHVVADL